MAELSPVAILAGGRGERLGALAKDLPKALVEVAGEPFLYHQLRLLRRAGARRVVICTGYRAEQIVDAVGDGAAFALDVAYSDDGAVPIGTAAALRKALSQLGDVFNVLYGDTYLRIDYAAVEAAFHESGKPALMTVLHNANGLERSNAVYADGTVIAYNKERPTPDMQWIDYGLSVLTPAALEASGDDLATVYRKLAERGLLAGYEASERFYHVGNPEALRETDEFLRGLDVYSDKTSS